MYMSNFLRQFYVIFCQGLEFVHFKILRYVYYHIALHKIGNYLGFFFKFFLKYFF